MSSDRQQGGGGGLSLQTLLISSAAAVTAASVVPLFWQQGTLFATAMTPVVVALVSEALKKPAERITAVTPRVARRTATGAAVRTYEPDAARTRSPERVGARGQGPERFEPLPPPPPRRSEDDPFGLRAAERPRRPRLQLALATGLLAFVVAAAVVTASELTIFDGSVSGERGKTSLFGGERTPAEEEPRDAEPTPAATPEQDEEATPTPTPEATETPTPSATPTPPAEATPVPTPAG